MEIIIVDGEVQVTHIIGTQCQQRHVRIDHKQKS